MKKIYLIISFIAIIFLLGCENNEHFGIVDKKIEDNIDTKSIVTDLYFEEYPTYLEDNGVYGRTRESRKWSLKGKDNNYMLNINDSWKFSFNKSGYIFDQNNITHCDDNFFCGGVSSSGVTIDNFTGVNDFAINIYKTTRDGYLEEEKGAILFPNFRFEYAPFIGYGPISLLSSEDMSILGPLVYSENFNIGSGTKNLSGWNFGVYADPYFLDYYNYTDDTVPVFTRDRNHRKLFEHCLLEVYDYEKINKLLDNPLFGSGFENMYFSTSTEKSENSKCKFYLEKYGLGDMRIQFMDFDKQLGGFISIYGPHNVEYISYIGEY